ncbi:MAG: efflux RND transporter periplasmic adaptor subunit, partial [Armatimonadota bacterium]
MGALILVLIAVGVGILIGRATTGGGPAEVAEKAMRYHCPMHPTYTSDGPGECPICGMDLVPIEQEEAKPARAATEGARYHCPMHPTYTSDKPGECPICGMTLVPIEQEATGEKPEGIPGLDSVKLSLQKQQLIGVRKGRVERRDLTKIIRTVGIVETDEARVFDVTTKISGWVEKLYVDETGQYVKKGQPLLTIYSPEVVATQRDYLLALKGRERLKRSRFPEVSNAGESLADAARQRLELWDVPASEIEKVRRTGETMRTVTLRVPASGYVL